MEIYPRRSEARRVEMKEQMWSILCSFRIKQSMERNYSTSCALLLQASMLNEFATTLSAERHLLLSTPSRDGQEPAQRSPQPPLPLPLPLHPLSRGPWGPSRTHQLPPLYLAHTRLTASYPRPSSCFISPPPSPTSQCSRSTRRRTREAFQVCSRSRWCCR